MKANHIISDVKGFVKGFTYFCVCVENFFLFENVIWQFLQEKVIILNFKLGDVLPHFYATYKN